MAPAEKLPAPEGTRPMMISMREMETLQLKTGSGLRETVPFKVFGKSEILTQIAQVGFMCPFHEFRAEIAKMQSDELLIVADPTESYGENWLLCLTRKAYDAQMELLTQKEKEKQDQLQAQEKADSAATNADDALATIVFEDRPVVARAWTSATSRDSHDDVEALSIRSSRQLIKISVTKMSDELNADYKFSDRDADQLGFVEWRQHKDPNYELLRMEQDIGLQGIPELVDGATQTSWFRSVNSALQYEPIVMDVQRRRDELDSDKLQAFLDKVLPIVEDALQQNETLDIFLDPFATLCDDDGGCGLGGSSTSTKNENAVKELRSFTDLVYSKNKTLPAIDWHPKKNGVVAVAAAANVNFAKRLDLLDRIDSSYILIWNFVDLIHPQLMLEAPQDVLAVRFNPTHPHLVAGGLFNGQVLVWDSSKAEQLLAKGKHTKATASSSSGGGGRASSGRGGAKMADDATTKQIPPVKPLYVSHIDSSHRRPVADLLWLPAGMEVNNRGHVVASSDGSGAVNQFVTIAGDGQVCFWDLRFKDPKYRGLARTKMEKGASGSSGSGGSGGGAAAAAKDAIPEVQFTPIYSIALTKVDTAGELGLKCICLERPKDDTTSSSSSSSSSSAAPATSRFFCGTEEGELVYADWRPHAASTSSSSTTSKSSHDATDGGGGGDDSSGSGVEYVQWLCRDHFRSTVTVRASPFFPSIYLTVSESNFHLWNASQVHKTAESNGPIFASPLSLSAITCAAFSPTRPAVVYVGKADGMLEVWDFMDQSHRASLSVGVTACALTSIEFRPVVPNAAAAGGGGGTTAGGGGASSNTHAAAATASKTGPKPGGGGGGAPLAPGGGGPTAVKQQLVAIGDQIGNLHIMEMPRTLARASNGERQAMEAYFKRESERMKATRETVERQQQELHGEGGAHGSGGAPPPPRTASPDGRSASLGAPLATPVDDEFFKQMENEFCRELGIDTAHVAQAS